MKHNAKFLKIRTDISGFTIVELLIAFSVFAVLVAVITPLFKQGSDFWQATRSEVELRQNLNSAVQLIGSELRQADPDSIQTGDAVNGEKVVIYHVPGDSTTRGFSLDTSSPGRLRFINGDTVVPVTSSVIDVTTADVVYSDPGFNITVSGRYLRPGAGYKDIKDNGELTVVTTVTPRAGR
ncbi:MAG: PulJ/GspJ family protein [Eubacteriales bacterium]